MDGGLLDGARSSAQFPSLHSFARSGLGVSPHQGEVGWRARGPSRLHAGRGVHSVGTVLAASVPWNALVFGLGRWSRTTWGRVFLNTGGVPSVHCWLGQGGLSADVSFVLACGC